MVALCIAAYLAFILFVKADYGLQVFKDDNGWGLFAAATILLLVGLGWTLATLRSDY